MLGVIRLELGDELLLVCIFEKKREGEREGERERQTDRQTDRQTETLPETETHRHI